MGNGGISHVKLTYAEDDIAIFCSYAINDKTLHSAQAWLAGEKNASATDLNDWLEKHGCKLDARNGPALIRKFGDGATEETYYRNGKLHRQNGPAYRMQFASGKTQEEYYRHGKRHRGDGPALAWYEVDGSSSEYFFRNGKFVKQENLTPLSLIPGVVVEHAERIAPARPGRSGPA
jgi:hypothetical protein